MSTAGSNLVIPRVGDVGFGDSIIVRDASDVERARYLMTCGEGHLLPVTDLTATLASDADLSCPPGQDCRDLSRSVIDRFHQRREKLAPWLRTSHRPDLRLLAFLHVHEKELTARYDPNTPDGFSYGSLVPVPGVRAVAERLAAAGYLTPRLFDCFHACPRCGSTRLNVREECPSCRSPDIADVRLIHHLRCAYLGPESDFETSDRRLVCPKCSRELRHYGSDHEAAGTALKCGGCGYSGSEPLVGFACMDCSNHFDGESVQKVRAFHYAISEAGSQFLLSAGLNANAVSPVLVMTLPLDLIRLLNASFAKGENFSLAELVYANEIKIVGAKGAKVFDASRKQLVADLIGRLGVGGRVVQGAMSDYVFLAGEEDPASTQERLKKLLNDCVASLRANLGVQLRVFEKADFLP